MNKSLKAGNSTAEGIAILAIIAVIMLATFKGTPNSTAKPSNTSDSATGNTSSKTENLAVNNSSYAKSISLNTGNARSAYQPYEEYISIYNKSREPISITNWQLKNSKSKRAYDFGGTLRYFPSDIAIIGQAALFISPNSLNTLQNIVLKPGETAVITTGSVGSQSPYKIVSFKENICSGYLEDLPEYTFTPSLTRNCPRPANESGVNNLDTECRKFIERLASCYTPKFNTLDKDGGICSNCVDDKPLSSSCVAFIKNRFNYGSCIAYHVGDKDFADRTWRIFLGKGWEMWANKYETVSLLDQFGRLVVEKTY
ncbi:MAG: lamin tail domain-containing protein [Patescibacteria group bacterium]